MLDRSGVPINGSCAPGFERVRAAFESNFTDGEIAYCTRRRDPVPHLAGRFAAKEAAMKALGTGHSRGVLWKDVEVVRHGGPPQLRLHGGAARRAEAMGMTKSLLTITHSESLALAQVILLGAG